MKSIRYVLPVLIIVSSAKCLFAEDAVFAEGAKPKLLIKTGAGEGPAWHPDKGIFTSGSGDINRYDLRSGKQTLFRKGAGTNGLLFDSKGRLLACERGPHRDQPRVTRTDVSTGELEVLAERYQGKRLNGPNDLTIDAQGRIYFTDRPGMNPAPDQTGMNAVYRIDPDRTIAQILAEPEIERPNGIVISPDDKTLYLIEAHIAEGGARMIRAYDLQPDGTVTNMRVFYNFYPGRSGDGMTIDSEGNLYVAAGLNLSRGTAETMDTKPGIHVISPEGKLLQHIPIPEDLITNCAFGGPDMQTLYVTAGKTLFRVRTQIPGTGR